MVGSKGQLSHGTIHFPVICGCPLQRNVNTGVLAFQRVALGLKSWHPQCYPTKYSQYNFISGDITYLLIFLAIAAIICNKKLYH